jgi:hypothetical protein
MVFARLFLTSFGKSDETNEVTAQLWAFCLLVLGWLAWWWNIIYPLGDILLVPQIVLSASLLGYFFGNIVVADRSGSIKLSFWLQQTSFFSWDFILTNIINKMDGHYMKDEQPKDEQRTTDTSEQLESAAAKTASTEKNRC